MKIYPDDWQVRLTSGVVSFVCIATALKLGPGIVNKYWQLMLLLVAAMIVGNLLGPLVCRLVFRSPSGPPNRPPRA